MSVGLTSASARRGRNFFTSTFTFFNHHLHCSRRIRFLHPHPSMISLRTQATPLFTLVCLLSSLCTPHLHWRKCAECEQ